MKKYLIIALCVMMGVCGSISSALAAETGTLTSGELVIGTACGIPTTIGLSPKVLARYVNAGTDATSAQWFSIATAHPGGNMMYGSAQNVNNIFMQPFTTGTQLTADLMDIPETAGSASDWSANGWRP